MHILLLSPPWIALPPPGYGGIENVVFNLAQGLIKRGHDVTTFATGDSKVPGKLMYYYKKAIGPDLLLKRTYPLFLLNHVSACIKQLPKNVDLIHNHCDYVAMHLLDRIIKRYLHTIHGPYYKGFDTETKIFDYMIYTIRDSLKLFKKHPLVTISDNQRTGMTDLNYIATVYNGVSLQAYTYTEKPDDYIYWIGRYSPQKGLKTAIMTALAAKKTFKFSAVAHGMYKHIFRKQILPFIDSKRIIFLGQEDNIRHKSTLLGHAKLFLFPLRGEEPFGLVMVESMATGTPVVAYARGSAPEVIKDGVTGYLVNPIGSKRGNWLIKKPGASGLLEAVKRIYSMPADEYRTMRRACRERVEQYFTTDIMVEDYLKAYKKVLSGQ